MLTVAKSDNPVQRIKDYGWVDHFIVVQLPEVFDFSHTLLVELEIVLFESQCDLLEDVVYNTNHEVLVIPVKCTDKNSEKVDIAVFDLDRLTKDTLHNIDHLVNEISHL